VTKDFDKYGWKLNETNLATLPDTAPKEIRALTKWLTLEGRRSSLEEWLNCVEDDGRIHGKFWHIGAWTHRKAHSNPNSANIAAQFHGTPKNAVEEVKAKYDGDMRALFHAPDGAWLVGTDAEGIQLRILAHYMKSEAYREAIVSGKKEDETDIHNLNKRAIGPVCRDRDAAKTFIYAWLLGAGVGKIAEILGTSTAHASRAIELFLTSLPELRRLKQIKIPADARRGGFIGLDGRFVQCNSEHLMLAGYLQNGESVIMKRAAVLWTERAEEAGYKFELVNDVHDEWQTIVYGSKEDAEDVGTIQCEAIEQVGEELELFCPLAGNTVVGKNWKETH